jgi:hypothetical protein
MPADGHRGASPLLASVGYPLLFMSGVMLQLFTGLTAYNMVKTEGWRVVAAIAAFALPPLSNRVVAYYAWGATGSMVNSYSVWTLVWMLLFLVVVGFGVLRDRRRY